jgi:DNA polymerase III delta prime subunit
MTDFNRYALMLEALAELKPEIDVARPPAGTQPVPALPSIDEVLAEFGPMPPEALFLGVASDGLPVLLNLHDPIPGPVLIIGDPGVGKTTLLHVIASSVGKMHQQEEVQFGALTNHPEEWNEMESIPNNVGVFPFYHKSSEDFILSLASWAHENKTSRQSVLLFMDDLDAVSSLDFDARQNLRWLLLRGPARRVWPIITLNPNRMENVSQWLDAFHTRIFGKMDNAQHVRQLEAEHAELDSLNIGSQFALREGEHWLRFWTPSIN